jgi:nicotinate-nucleotide pyrophosphorylase (carboxylating)
MDINELIINALKEDVGTGDVTTEFLGLLNEKKTAFLIAKNCGVLCGIDVAKQVFLIVDNNLKITIYKNDGETIKKGDKIAKIEGKASAILIAERVALNFLQRLSGIATMTKSFTDKISGYRAKILDTRKTTPLLRNLEKYAVRTGGGFNHRFGLYDMILLKENHIRSAGSITNAVKAVKQKNTSYKIEVEVTNLKELDEAIKCDVDRVMLDNMDIETMTKAVKKYKGRVEFEASGNVNLDNVQDIAKTGVNFISSGALTHSFKSLDISLLFKEGK